MTTQVSLRPSVPALCFILAFSVAQSPRARAQERAADEAAVLESVQNFFNAMSKKDEELARSVMREDGQYYGVRLFEDGAPIFQATNATFIARVAAEERSLLESMYEPLVLIRGPLSVVWTAYDFHIDGEFSHCGVDAFTLLKKDGQWKIAATAFTMEKERCENVRSGFKNSGF